jgi:predicted dithiol-disulfide oxidoreductase (DUF899 family)
MATADTGTATTATPPIVDRDTWLREREALLAREKAHTREGDAIAAARRRLPMTEVAPISLDGAGGPTPLIDIFEGRDQLVVYKHMFYPGEPIDRQCEGCTLFTWDIRDASYLNARGVTFAIFGAGPYEELARFREFMGHSHPWYSNYQVDDPAIGGVGLACYLRQGDRVFLTYETTNRGVEAFSSSLHLLDMTAYGRQETWEDSPVDWPQGPTGLFWRTDDRGQPVGFGENFERPGRPTPQWTRPGATPVGNGRA